MKLIKIFPIILGLFLILCFNLGISKSDILKLEYGALISGQTIYPGGSTPWLTATFESSTPGTVNLILSTPGLINQEFVTEWDFNLDPNLDPTILNFTHISGPQATISTGKSFEKADGDGYFDIKFAFPTSNSEVRFIGGSTSIYIITGDGITAASFNFLSSSEKEKDTNDQLISAAHIQGIGQSGNDSTWVTVPEPGLLLLLGLGLTAVGIGSRWMRRK